MKILHYLFGLPPVRTGGLLAYVLDLAEEQRRMGHEVVLLIPGPISARNRERIAIRFFQNYHGIACYRIFNPQYVTNGFGIKCPEAFMDRRPTGSYLKWLKRENPDIFHVHSLMGLDIQLLEAAKHLRLPMIYTTHDYYGLCPKIDLLKGNTFCQESSWENCGKCCENAYTLKRLRLEQSDIYRFYCNCQLLMKLIHSNQVEKLFGFISSLMIKRKQDSTEKDSVQDSLDQEANNVSSGVSYQKLANYYRECFCLIDWFHFNSEQAREVYAHRIPDIQGEVLAISSSSMQDHRRIRYFGQTLRLGYLGTPSIAKGYDFLRKELDILYTTGRTDFFLNTYFLEGTNAPYIRNHPPYDRSNLADIFDEMDVLIVPSIWKESFGLVASEALSYGIPVLLSENVGAGTLLSQYPGIGKSFSIHSGALAEKLMEIYDNRRLLQEMNQRINDYTFIFDYKDHVKAILKMYEQHQNNIIR